VKIFAEVAEHEFVSLQEAQLSQRDRARFVSLISKRLVTTDGCRFCNSNWNNQ